MLVFGAERHQEDIYRQKIHTHPRADGLEHSHVHVHHDEKAEGSHHRFAPRSVAVGMVHGLAGSAGLMLLALPTISSPAVALLYIAIFGAGSIAGMMIMSLLMGLPLYYTAGRFTLVNKGIRLLAGAFSLIWGAMLINEKFFSA